MTLGVLIATTNPAKAERLRSLCAELDVEPVDARIAGELVVDEHGASHLANAVRKAVEGSSLYGGIAIASDGGLAIPALGDAWERLLTGRTTGGDVSDAEHARRLLARMRDLSGRRRAAHWVESVAVARGGTLVAAWEVDGLHGRIAEEYRPAAGPAGFWVSGLWVSEDGQRYGDLSAQELAAYGDPWSVLAGPVRGLLSRIATAPA